MTNQIIDTDKTNRLHKPIIDADRLQAQAAADLLVGKRIGQIDRTTEGKSWHIIGAVGPFLKIQTHNNNGGTHTRLISADDYQRCDRYKSRIPVRRYPHAMPIIDADGIQATRSANHRTTQPDIIVAREAAQ